MRKVLIFTETPLQTSETFILAQMQALSRYVPVLAGLERARPSLSLLHPPLLLSDRAPLLSDLRAKVYRRSGIAPWFHRKAKKLNPDLIHAHFASGGRHALPLARALRVPLVVTFHGADVTVKSSQPQIFKHLAQQASLFLCVSEFIRSRALDAGFPAHKLQVHYTGIDSDLFSPEPPQKTSKGVLFVGRLVEKKGCEYLLRAMQLVQTKHPHCELTIIGNGPLDTSLRALAAQLQIRCQFLGSQPPSAVREALRAARVFCVPSVTAANGDSEGLGMVFAEAQAMGIPVVSTHHGGIPEVVLHRKTGLLAPERDSESLAEALSVLLGDDTLWHQFHQAAPRHIREHFDLATQTGLLENIFTETVTRNGHYDLSPEAKPQPMHTISQANRK